MCPITYYTMIRKSKDKIYFRYHLVIHAKENGIKPTARKFSTTPKTVRKWLYRYNKNGVDGLKELSKAPHNIPHKISKELEDQIVSIKKSLPTWGANRLKRDFNIPCSGKTISRIFKLYGIQRKIKKKYRRKNDLREIKMKYRLFGMNFIDTKDLEDIPRYWPYMKQLQLPEYQFTFREMVAGLQFLGFASEKSLTHSTLFINCIIKHLAFCGVNLNGSIIQSDNGSEFVGSWNAHEDSEFTKTIERSGYGCIHQTIPPGAHRWQADIETVHNNIEMEFYDIEDFYSNNDFKQKATAYQYFYNIVRPNSSKGGKTPLQIIMEREPNINPKIVLLPPIFLDDLISNCYTLSDGSSPRGYDLPSQACKKIF